MFHLFLFIFMFQKWVKAHKSHRAHLINTTNGIERQHRDFKLKFLEEHSDNTVCGMVETCIEKFIPACMRK